MRDLLHLECVTVTGKPLGEILQTVSYADPAVIFPREKPLASSGTLAVLRGNLAPNGAILRTTTASPHLQKHCGPAIVFDTYEDMLARIDDPALPVNADSVLILRNAGAVGVPGLPEWGSIPIPKKLLLQGVKDVVRISDSRMSGTSSGTIILHVAPEAAVGGPLALVQDGDLIELDVEERQLIWHISAHELAERRTAWRMPHSKHRRGYPRLYTEHVLQPDQGCDFDFLRPETDADLTFVPPTVGRS